MMKLAASSGEKSAFKLKSIHNMFVLDSFEHINQEISIKNTSPVELRKIAVRATLTMDEESHANIRKVLKKSLPSSFRIQLLLAPNNVKKGFLSMVKRNEIDHLKILDDQATASRSNGERC